MPPDLEPEVFEAFERVFEGLEFDKTPPEVGAFISTSDGVWTWDGSDWVHPEGKLLPWQKRLPVEEPPY